MYRRVWGSDWVGRSTPQLAGRLAAMGFYRHKEIHAAENRFYLQNEIRVAGIELNLHKDVSKKFHE